MDTAAAAQLFLMYVIMPLWLAAGFADWLCHRVQHIETTSGYPESLIHLAMQATLAPAVLAGMFLDINPLVLLIMVAGFVAHEIVSFIDFRFASAHRVIPPIEQRVHDYLTVLPFTAFSFVLVLHWADAMKFLHGGFAPGDWSLRLKSDPLPIAYTVSLLAALILLGPVAFLEELLRGLRRARH